ncbi:MAG: glycoside hydrolase family 9 [Ruminococcus sp.]|nr:glycoside hydrolase family 9 [Ruminococcus sp.]
MHKRMVKTITGSLMAATMAASTASMFVAPMSASAGNCLGQNDFNDGVGLPWHTCETQPADVSFELTGDAYKVEIVNVGGQAAGGESRWDCQFRHRSLKIQSGHTYKISFDVNSTADGEMATHVADLKGENPVWLSNHQGTEAWSAGSNCSQCPNGHSSNSGNIVVKKGDNHFESTFRASSSLEVAEWAFHFGGAGEWQNNDCFPAGTFLTFDNMELTCETCGDAYTEGSCNWDPTNELGVVTPRSDVRVNQVGYLPNLVKEASYATDTEISTPLKFEIQDASGKTVYTGTGKPIGKDADSGEYIQILDFTDFTTEGADYVIVVDDTSNVQTNKKTGVTYDMYKSHPFSVATTAYDGMLRDALNYYYQNRSGCDIESAYITSGDKENLAHTGGHAPTDMAYVQSKWQKSYAGEFDGDKTYSIDCVGGWYDAGDHGKYVVNGGISVWTLQNIYEWSVAQGTDSKFDDDQTMAIPQKYSVGKNTFDGTGSPDILDEARVELEWMFNMMVDSKDPYWGDMENMVYHKMHDHKWTGLATHPADYQDSWGTTRIVKPPSTAATLNMVACAAQAARLWEGIDDTFAAECLANAKAGYEAALANDDVFAPLDHAIGGGAYGDNYVGDDFYWAACELYATTGDKTYYDDLSGYKNPNDTTGTDKAFSLTTSLGGGENNGSFSSFNWGCTAGLGTLCLYLNQDILSETDAAAVEDSILAAADKYIAKRDEQGMGIPYQGTTFEDPINIGPGIKVTGYEWGSNSFVVNNAIVMAYAYDIDGTNKYASGVTGSMDYILGRNANGVSYVTGYGEYTTQRPHHRYWSYELDKAFPMAPAGVMSGGPGQGLQDPYVAGLGYDRETTPPQLCYVDSIEAWSVNEVTINWNAPFAWVVSFLEDEAASIPAPGVVDPTTDTTGGGEVTLWGDANVDGQVKMDDVIKVMMYSANAAKNPITPQGLLNADCYQNGDGVDTSDALSIQKKITQVISVLPESYL